MRICLYTETALPKIGGQELVVDALARGFQHLGHEVVVLAAQPRRLTVDDSSLPYEVVRHPRFWSTRRFVAWYRYYLTRLHRRKRFDVVHCHSVYPCGYVAALARARLGCPIILTSHGGDVREGNARLCKPGLPERHELAVTSAYALVAISRFTEAGYLRLGAIPRQIVSIPNGVHLSELTQVAPRPRGLPDDVLPEKYVLFLGRLSGRKGVDLLLNAWTQTCTMPESWRLVIAGDGDEREGLAEYARELGILHRVRFVGLVQGSTKRYLLQNARCVVLPSRGWEAFPLTVLEAYAAGVPVVGTRIPGLEDLIEPDRTGELVPPESPEALAETLSDLVLEPAKWQYRGQQARRVAESYDWSVIARRHVELYESLRAGRLPMAA